MYENIDEMFHTLLILSYISGGLSLFLSYFRPGINPNIPVVRFEGLKVFVMILLISIFWPIYAILSIAYHGYRLVFNHNNI